jgi:hypothetical protein
MLSVSEQQNYYIHENSDPAMNKMFAQFDIADIIGFFQSLDKTILPIVIFLGFIIILWFLGRIIKFFIRRNRRIPADARNGVRNIITLLQILVGFIGIALIFDVDPELIVSTSTLVATAIGFASTSIAANLVGGLYLIVTRPFGVGDFINTQGCEGIVAEIGLLYTKLMQFNKTIVTVPNSSLLTSSVLNSNIMLMKDPKSWNTEKTYSLPGLVSKTFTAPFKQEEIVRYSTKIEVSYSAIDPPIDTKQLESRISKILDNIADTLFGFPIEYYLGNYTYRQEVYFIITASDANRLYENYFDFLEQLWKGIFPELRGEV